MRSARPFTRFTHASARRRLRLPRVQFLHASFLVMGLLLDTSARAQTPITYTITDLGTLPGMEMSEAYGINTSGQVVGTAKAYNAQRAFIYTPGQPLTDIGTLGGTWSYGDAINTSGQVTGVFDSKTGGHAYVYTPGSGMTSLGSLTGPTGFSRGFAINTSGQVAGEDNGHRAFLYTPGVGMTMIALPGNVFHSGARSINDAGQVTGYFSTDGGAVQRPFVYTPGQGVMDLRAVTGKPLVAGFAINAKGQVTGITDTGEAFVYTPGAGAIVLEGTTNGNAINSLGHVVGGGTATTGFPFLYKPGEPVLNLNNVLPAGSGWVIHTATGINDAGQITGTGRNPTGQIRAFLLSPVIPTTQTGTILVSTNQAGATFTISGPASYSGTGASFMQTNAPAGQYTITYGALTGYTPPQNETKVLSPGGVVTFTGTYGPVSTLTTIYADDTEAGGLLQTTVTNIRQVPGGLAADVRIDSSLFFWLGLNATTVTPASVGTIVAIDAAALKGLLPECVSKITGQFPFLNCASPGSGTWTVTFSGAGVVAMDFKVTERSAANTILTAIGLRDNIQLAEKLLSVPYFRQAAECLARIPGLAGIPCSTLALARLAANTQQRNQMIQILKDDGIQWAVSYLLDQLLDHKLYAISGHMVTFTVRTLQAGHRGIARVRLVAR